MQKRDKSGLLAHDFGPSGAAASSDFDRLGYAEDGREGRSRREDRLASSIDLGSLPLLGLVLALLVLVGCSGRMLEMCSPLPAPSPVPRAYLPVNDLPPERGEPLIAPDQRARIETELLAARNRQATSAKPRQAP
jgi:hypothetical protein